jgi:hypothetical protein
MRIPTSVIVMSLLTAAPFGLAIRDTVKNKPGSELEDLYRDLESTRGDSAEELRREAELMAEYEREREHERALEARKHQENLKRLDTLYGSEKASMGIYFASFPLGAPFNEAVEEKATSMLGDDFLSPTVTGDDTINHVSTFIFNTDPSDGESTVCETLREKLSQAWGPGVNGTWLNPTTKQRAVLQLNEEPCKLTFSKYLDAASWVAALPMDFVGLSATKAGAKAGPLAEVFDDVIEWGVPGTGYGVTATSFIAYLENNKVVSVRVGVDTDFDTLVEIRDALSAKLKAQPTRNEDTGAWVWKKKPGITLVQDPSSNNVTVVIGKDTYQ